jgi:hypothetical protein
LRRSKPENEGNGRFGDIINIRLLSIKCFLVVEISLHSRGDNLPRANVELRYRRLNTRRDTGRSDDHRSEVCGWRTSLNGCWNAPLGMHRRPLI